MHASQDISDLVIQIPRCLTGRLKDLDMHLSAKITEALIFVMKLLLCHKSGELVYLIKYMKRNKFRRTKTFCNSKYE